uniref:Uncharacterized protein n=2 Tax=Meloidogyne TaxID=189290 RepID=A0A6V7V2A4_MELEN|nr:unnamed protein product [Meloidogyne enterolobii]
MSINNIFNIFLILIILTFCVIKIAEGGCCGDPPIYCCGGGGCSDTCCPCAGAMIDNFERYILN